MKKNAVHRIIAMAILVIMVIVSAVPVSAAFERKVLDGVVYIEVWVRDDWGLDRIWLDGDEYSEVGFRGTGFFVGEKGKDPRHILTNHHVIEPYINYVIDFKDMGFSGEIYIAYAMNDFDQAYMVDYDVQLDVALLRLTDPTDKRVALPLNIVAKDQAQGEPVYAVGFPAIADDAILRKSYYGKSDATISDGVINRLPLDTEQGRKEIQHSAEITGGNSGGPLVDDKGRVIGINTRAYIAANYNLAVSIEDVMPMMNKWSVNQWIIEGNANPWSGGIGDLPWLWIAIIGGGAVVLILIVVLVIVLTRKKQPAPAHAAAYAAGGVQAPVQQPVGVGMGQAPGYGPAPVQGAYPGAPAAAAFIRSLAAQHNNVSVPINQTPIMIGRDPAVCKIVFKEETPGVSGKHCQIYFDAAKNCFILTDMGSSYGTFLMNGQKLTPNTPTRLNAKEHFYLASKDNTFIVDM